MRNLYGYRGRIARGWYVLRYHRLSQLLRRAAKTAAWHLGQVRLAARYAGRPVVLPAIRAGDGLMRMARARLECLDPQRTSVTAAEILRGDFSFLNERRHLADPIDWRLDCWPDATHLWRFHLHCHDYLLDLVAQGVRTGEPECVDRAWEIVGQWLAGNRVADPRCALDAWHPYCISRRLPVWIAAWLSAPPPHSQQNDVLVGIYQQARYLDRHLERDLGGNHLLENLRALVLAGCFLDCREAERWRSQSARRLRRELALQVLPHGEHFERSPMYHAKMLEAVLDVCDAVREALPEIADGCASSAKTMAAFLEKSVHPDGGIPLFGDSSLDETPSTAGLLARAAALAPPARLDRRPPSCSSAAALSAVGDYWTFRDADSFLLFDAGPVGADHLPAHAHADLLSIEASLHGERLFVDSGVFNYEDDAMRRYCRSTAAHNTVEIDFLDQCDTWSKFRMGYRGWPFGFATGETSGFHWARAHHNAYRCLKVPTVGRWMACRPGGPWLCVDWALGKGHHYLVSRLHVHPGVIVEQTAEDEVRLHLRHSRPALRFFGGGKICVDDGWYCPAFGRRERSQVVTCTLSCPLPAVCGWALMWSGCEGAAVLEVSGQVSLRWSQGGTDRVFLPIEPAGLVPSRHAVLSHDVVSAEARVAVERQPSNRAVP